MTDLTPSNVNMVYFQITGPENNASIVHFCSGSPKYNISILYFLLQTPGTKYLHYLSVDPKSEVQRRLYIYAFPKRQTEGLHYLLPSGMPQI